MAVPPVEVKGTCFLLHEGVGNLHSKQGNKLYRSVQEKNGTQMANCEHNVMLNLLTKQQEASHFGGGAVHVGVFLLWGAQGCTCRACILALPLVSRLTSHILNPSRHCQRRVKKCECSKEYMLMEMSCCY